MKISRNEIGFFMVKTDAGEFEKVVISQDVVFHYDKEHVYTGKHLTLNSVDGPPVSCTNRENVFRLKDGTELRRR